MPGSLAPQVQTLNAQKFLQEIQTLNKMRAFLNPLMGCKFFCYLFLQKLVAVNVVFFAQDFKFSLMQVLACKCTVCLACMVCLQNRAVVAGRVR